MNLTIRMLIVAGVLVGGLTIALLIVRALVDKVMRLRRRQIDTAATPPPESFMLPEPATRWTGQMDQAFDQMVHRSGTNLTTSHALAWICFGGTVGAGALALWQPEMWLAALGMAVGMALPLIVFLILQRRWRRKIEDQFPDALFLVSRSIRAGLSLEQALALVGEHGTAPLAEEFKQVSERCRLGLTVTAALQGLADKVELEDADALVTVVTLHRTVGGNLAEQLDRLAVSARDRNQFHGFFRAATALGRLTAVCLAAIAPVLFVGYLVWQPEYMTRFAETTAGLLALGVAAVLELVGVVWLWILLRFEA